MRLLGVISEFYFIFYKEQTKKDNILRTLKRLKRRKVHTKKAAFLYA